MKINKNLLNSDSSHTSVGINTFSLIAVSLLWGHMLGLVTWWALPITVVAAMIGYGTEVSRRRESRSISL